MTPDRLVGEHARNAAERNLNVTGCSPFARRADSTRRSVNMRDLVRHH